MVAWELIFLFPSEETIKEVQVLSNFSCDTAAKIMELSKWKRYRGWRNKLGNIRTGKHRVS